MFVKSIKKALKYTRPLLIGKLYYKEFNVSNDIATLIVLNKQGDILTTAKNANYFLLAKDYIEIYPPILKKLQSASSRQKKKLESEYGIDYNSIVGISTMIIDIVKKPDKLVINKHPYLDLAVISLNQDYQDNILVKEFPVFAKKNANIGSSICSLGFCFPEYQSFIYNQKNCSITNNNAKMNFPIFPNEGIVTRNIAYHNDQTSLMEISNKIIPGQEGGPLLDTKGNLVGIIVDYKEIKEYNLSLGIGINIETIKDFLNDLNIEYEVEK